MRKERGLEPAPDRTKRTTWRECLAAHWDVLAAADCFTVEGWTPRGLTRFTVLVLMHLASRRGQIAGISAEPDGPWGTQLMRHAPDAEDGCLRHIRFLIHDRDPLFRPAGRDTLPPADVTPLRRPARAPTLNAYTERFVRTIKDSCLERMVLIGERARGVAPSASASRTTTTNGITRSSTIAGSCRCRRPRHPVVASRAASGSVGC